jgi:hypothetical protein
MAEKTERLPVPIDPEFKAEFEQWWRQQPEFKNAADAVRHLMRSAIDAGPWNGGPKNG